MSDITLKRFAIKGYRSLSQANLDFSAGAIGLIGPNASGKTNVGRAFQFFCSLVKGSLPRIGGPGQANTPLSKAQWQPLDVDPSALLFDPSAGQSVSLRGDFDIPGHLLPENQGGVIKQMPRSGSLPLSIEAISTVETLGTGRTRLVPRYTVLIQDKPLVQADIQQLQGLWGRFEAARLQALRPAQEFLTAMNNLRNKSVAGYNAFDRMNEHVRKVEPNFVRVSFIGNNPMGIEGDISDLSTDNMSSGNLRALQLLSAARNPEHENALVIHIEEPESHFHPSLQRAVLREILGNCRQERTPVVIETHSPQILRELYANKVPVYRCRSLTQFREGGPRQSDITELPRTPGASDFLAEMGVDAGFALLGGVTLIVDGTTDPPAYRHWLSLFPELSDLLYCFVPIGCLDARGLDLEGIGKLSAKTLLIADGHFREQHGDRLQGKCESAGITFLQLDHWGVENFITERALRAACADIPGLTVSADVKFAPMRSFKDTAGIDGFSKTHHMATAAKHVTKEELMEKPDFMRIVDHLKNQG